MASGFLSKTKNKLAFKLKDNKMAKALYKKMLPRNHVVFYPSFFCDQSCPYCLFRRLNFFKEIFPFEKARGGEDWANSFNEMEPTLIDVSGGEPFLWQGFPAFLKHIDKKHTLLIVTNLTWDIQKFTPSLRSCKAKIMINASFHTTSMDVSEFIDKIKLLKKDGFTVTSSVVAYPKNIPKLRGFKAAFDEAGIPFNIVSYIDPDYKYSDDERKQIEGLIDGRDKGSISFEEESRLKECEAGINHFVFCPNGDVYACHAGFYYVLSSLHKKWEAKKEKFYLGNVFDKTFKPRSNKTLCKYPCSELCDINHAKVKWK